MTSFPSSPKRVDSESLLVEHNGDVQRAFDALVKTHNALVDSHARVCTENSKLWNWCRAQNTRQRTPQTPSASLPPSTPAPVPSPISSVVTRQHSLRKASSLDLGKSSSPELQTLSSSAQDIEPSTPRIIANEPGSEHLSSSTSSNNSAPPSAPVFPSQQTTSSASSHLSPLLSTTTPNTTPTTPANTTTPTTHPQPSPAVTKSQLHPIQVSALPASLPSQTSPVQKSSPTGSLPQSTSAMPPPSPQMSSHQQPRRPRLVPSLLPSLSVRVVGSHIKQNDRGKEVISFTINLILDPSPETNYQRAGWSLEKKYSDVILLDQQVKAKHSRSQAKKLAQLPDKSLFKDHAPNRVDLRKQVLQSYLQSLANAQLTDKTEICLFFNSNVVHHSNAPVSNPTHKQGYLTKRGRNFGAWQIRYYVLQGPILSYYDTPGGASLGRIDVTGAQIGRQQSREPEQSSHSGHEPFDEYRHAFLIREAKRDSRGIPSGEEIDHILCAQSDVERDEWVHVLACWYTGEYHEPPSHNSTPSISSTQSATVPLKKSSKEYNSFSPHRDSRESRHPHLGAHLSPSELPLSTSLPSNLNSSLLPPVSPASSVSSARSGFPHSVSRLQPPSSTASSNDLTTETSPRSQSELGHYRDMGDDFVDTVSTQPATVSRQGSTPKDINDRFGARKRQHSADAANSNIADVTPKYKLSDGPTSGKSMSSTRATVTSPLQSQISPLSNQPERSIISGPINVVPISSTSFKKESKEPVSAIPTHSNPSRAAKTKSSFWNFAARNDKRDTSSPAPKINPVFGVPLADAVAVARIREGFELPAVVYRCVEYLEAKEAQKEEGIYRLSGSSNVIKTLKEKFNTEGDINLLASNEYYDPHAVAGLLKSFLRELPVHILTRDLQPTFMRVIDLKRRHDRVNELGALVTQLPIANYTLLRFLTAHLIHIVQNERYNKMSLRNVAIVFSPTLALPATLFSLFLTEFDALFAMEQDLPAPVRLEASSSGDSGKHLSVVQEASSERSSADDIRNIPPTIIQPSTTLSPDSEGNVIHSMFGASPGSSVSDLPSPTSTTSHRRKSRNSILYTEVGADKLLESATKTRLERQNEDEEDVDIDEVVDDIDDEITNSTEDGSSANREHLGTHGMSYADTSPRNKSANSLPMSPIEAHFDMQRSESPLSAGIASQRVTPRTSGSTKVSNDSLLPQMPHSPGIPPNSSMSWKEPVSPMYAQQQGGFLNVGSGHPPSSPNARTTYHNAPHGLPASPRPNVMTFGKVQD